MVKNNNLRRKRLRSLNEFSRKISFRRTKRLKFKGIGNFPKRFRPVNPKRASRRDRFG